MATYKARPVYCYKIKTGELFQYPSIYKACKGLDISYNSGSRCNISKSIKSDNKRKASAYGFVWFDQSENGSIVDKNQLYLGLNYRYERMNHKGVKIDWLQLKSLHKSNQVPIIAYDDNGQEIYYQSVKEAAEDFDTPDSNISRVLNNQNKGRSSHHLGQKRLKACGWYFRYA